MRKIAVSPLATVLSLALVVTAAACDDGASATDDDAGSDAAFADYTGPSDTGPPGVDPGDTALPDAGPVRPVELDLNPYIEGGDDSAGPVRVVRVEDRAELIGGEAATGRVGDYLLANDRVRFIVEADDRAIGVCPEGGNVIDASVTGGSDVVGEICLMLNLGRTLKPERFDILRDGSDGGPGVLAVTGHLELLDFLNIVGFVGAFLRQIGIEVPLDPDMPLPLATTVFYVLRPGDTGLHVVTALRNDGDAGIHVPVSHVIDSGGVIQFFNPLNDKGGFGVSDIDRGEVDAILGDPLMAIAFRGPRGSHTYVPETVEGLGADLPIGGVHLVISGVAVSLLRTHELVSTLLTPAAAAASAPGRIHIEPGETDVVRHWHFVGDGRISSTFDPAYATLGVPTGRLSGRVTGADDQPAEGVRVTAVDPADRALNQTLTDADGAYAMRAPAGTYRLRAWRTGHVPVEVTGVALVADGEASTDLDLDPTALLRVRARTPDGVPVPAKITVRCNADCPAPPTSFERDVDSDWPGGDTFAIAFAGMSGEVEIPLPPAHYRVTASRGGEWSIWPPDAIGSHGAPVELAAGATVEIDAEIAHVVDTAEALSGDFHVHAVNSPDAPVGNAARIATFLAEGVDVIVSTDHAFITDYAPVIEAMGASDALVSLIGEEITTFDYGHYNGFPLERDPAARNGGALDWAGGPGPGLTPDEIFGWVHDHPGEQVMQVNHPAGGYFGAMIADPFTGMTFRDRAEARLPAAPPDPVTGDTGLWSDRFTAIEILNGSSERKFWGVARWWFAMLGRGFTPTATAVSDTHRQFTSQSGGPRSYVFVGPEVDRPSTFDRPVFIAAVNAGKVVGSNGPYIELAARTDDGERYGLGDTVPSDPGRVIEFEVTVDVPAWMTVDRIDVHTNVTDDLFYPPGESSGDPLPPDLTVPIEWADADLRVVAEGAIVHAHRRKTIAFELAPVDDSYVVVIVRAAGDEVPTMYPVAASRGTRPFAYTNPIYVDTDGDGYDNPPLLGRLEARRAELARPMASPDARRPMRTAEDLRRVFEAVRSLH